MSHPEFADEVAIVTGAPGGIGRGITKALLAAGARVIATGPAQDEIDQLARENPDSQHLLHGIVSDLSGPDGWRDLVRAIRKLDHNVSIVIHSASPPRLETQNVLDVTEDEWDSMMNTNLRSGFFLARECARDMIERKISGRMLFITSLHKHSPRNLPHYSASKAGQFMVVRELARALGPSGIRVNGIAPGAIPGGGFTMDDDSKAAFSNRIPLGRPGTPEDIAQVALTLLSDQFSRYVTGEVIAVDGGLDLFNWIDRPVV